MFSAKSMKNRVKVGLNMNPVRNLGQKKIKLIFFFKVLMGHRDITNLSEIDI